MKKLFTQLACGVLLLVLAPGLVFAQDTGTITGTVTDASTQESIPGVNVRLEGTTRGAASNADGVYEIERVRPGEYTVVASFIGYRRFEATVVVEAGDEVVQDVVLEQDRLGLDEVVVTGQGAGIEQKRLATTTEVVSGADIDQFQVGRLDQAIQSQLPNTQIRLNSGQPGTTSLIRSRGPVSASGNTTPVIYVDGVRVDNNSTGSPLDIGTGGARSSSIADIPLDNIERIEFIKGGAATTRFGSDAANGVLQIFTRGGEFGRNQLNFETTLGVETATKNFLKYDRTADVVFDSGFRQSYKLAGSGGVGDITYSFSGKMLENNTARLGNEQIRYDLRTKLSANPIETLRYTGSLAFVSNRFTRVFNANTSFSTFGNIEGGQLFSTADGPVTIDELSNEQFATVRDSLQTLIDLQDNVTNVRRFQTSQVLQYNPVSSVDVRLTGGVDYRLENNKEVVTNQFLSELGAGGNSSIADFNREFLGLTLSANVNHQASWRFLDFTTNIGGDVFRDEINITRIDADDVPDGASTVTAGAETTGSDDITQVSQQGFYVKENIGFGDRFFLDLGLRGDNNSAFGDEVGVQWYPSIGGSYTLSDEPAFRERVPERIVSNLKFRANYGESGNFPAPFANDRLIAVNPFLGQTSFSFADPGDPGLGPERVETWEVGGDLGFLDDRVALNVTYYQATTRDALFDAPFAPSIGQNNQVRNLGEIRNKGWEFATEIFVLDTPDYGLTLTGSLNTLDNEVLDNGPAPKFNNGGFLFLGTFVDEGQPIGFLQGDQPFFNPQTGLIDSVATDAVLGDPNPDRFGSLSLRGRYKGLGLLVTADYQTGAQGVNVDDVLRFFNGVQDEDRFPNPNNEETPPALTQGLSFFNLAGVWAEDTDYLKVRLISLDYQLPEQILPVGIRSARVGASVTNPFNFVKSSFDPEVTGSDNAAGTVSGIFGFGTASPPRQWSFTLNVGL